MKSWGRSEETGRITASSQGIDITATSRKEATYVMVWQVIGSQIAEPMLAHTNEPLIDLHITGPAGKKEEALAALRVLRYIEKTEQAPPWRDAFLSEIRENEGGVVLKVTRERNPCGSQSLIIPAMTRSSH